MKFLRHKFLLAMVILLNLHQAYAATQTKNPWPNRTYITEMKNQQKKTYIIYMDKLHMPVSFIDHFQWYDACLKSVSDSAEILYIYNNVVHGFSTQLTAKESKLMERQPGILSVLPDVKYELHTTRTPEFLGLHSSTETSLPTCNASSEVIIGVVDTGVWPESKSFKDSELGPVPSHWKGECEEGKNFNSSSCNRKLIGARFFSKGYEADSGSINETTESKSPADDQGHGTHTSSTAAGSVVPSANLYGYANGTAQGIAACARVAMYKVCWMRGCFGSDMLAAMDKAVEDGVNILSVSLGGPPKEYHSDYIALGAFAAVVQGIFVSCSAGNDGPSAQSTSNTAPWITTVGAGTLDRDFPVYIKLGNGSNFSGVAFCNGEGLPSKFLPLVYGAAVSHHRTGHQCTEGSLIPKKVNGTIVVCDRDGENTELEKGIVVKAAGGLGMILANPKSNEEKVNAYVHFLPAAAVGVTTSDLIKNYIYSSTNPTATIACGVTRLGIQPSPIVAKFSSRGPNRVTENILKPDIIAPGVEVIAGWTDEVGPSEWKADTRKVSFNIISGTSVSCPHVSGLAALLKTAHPDWSPAAIRSALMTTAYTTYKNGETIKDSATENASTPFDHGAGHVDFISALHPGLVYNMSFQDYLDFLCALNYTSDQIKLFTSVMNITFNCDSTKTYHVEDLNYPSFAVQLQTTSSEGGGDEAFSTVKYRRTLTNVGPTTTYKVLVSSQTELVNISVEPGVLSFSELNENKNYTVTFNYSSMPSSTTTSFARLDWSDGKHVVSSPITFSWESSS
ncbi:subtilisin-like protease SBT1.7 [Malania oleifera]|uniref:subtilisin-like protease SBT1.7 n=1 Tax=Malania oleifera TaxID=397392 RepID=UPI0025AE49F1|nr:subtilisin-like protease SBT1.7 [Malania oleifera]